MRQTRLVSTFLATAALLVATTTRATADVDLPCELHFRVAAVYDASPRRLDVTLTFPSEGRTESYLRLTPTWAGVKDFANYLSSWRGLSDGVTVDPTDQPFRFKVSHPSVGAVRVAFRATGGLPDPDNGMPQDDLDEYRTQIGADWFQFFGYGVFPSVESYGDDRRAEMCITVSQPGNETTPLFGSYLPGQAKEATSRLSGSPSLLRHAFYAGGPGWRVVRRSLQSGDIGIAIRGHFPTPDDDFVNKTFSLIDAERRFWRSERAPMQWAVIAPNYSPYNQGGTLVNGTFVLYGNLTFSPNSAAFESIVGHENMHQWIPRRLGAHSSDPAQYWLSEGFTDYYTHRLLLASGAWTLQQYADALNKQLQGYWHSPARNATANSIAPRFFSDHDAGKQMYSRGEVLAATWDLALRRAGRPGLDDVLRGVELPEGSEGTGDLANARVLSALNGLLGDGPAKDVEVYINQGKDLPFPPDLLGPCFAVRRIDAPRWMLGFDIDSVAAKRATGVVAGGPAYNAGLRDGMELAGWSIFFGDVTKDVSLTTLVDGKKTTMTFSPQDGTHDSLPKVDLAPATDGAACQSWIRRNS